MNQYAKETCQEFQKSLLDTDTIFYELEPYDSTLFCDIQSQKNVWKSDKSWEPEKIWKFKNLNSKFKMA